MKELRKLVDHYGERYSTATIYVIFVVLSLLVASVLFGILHSTGIMKFVLAGAVQEAEFGGAFAGFFVTLIFLIRSYNQASKSEKLTIRGNVLFTDGSPVKGALIFVEGVDRQKETDTTGWFEIEVNEQKSWVVRASYGSEVAHATVKRGKIRESVPLVMTSLPSHKGSPAEQVAPVAEVEQDISPVLSLENIGDKQWEEGDWERAQSSYLQAVGQAEQITFDDKVTIARLYRKIGRLHREFGDFDRALEYYENGQLVVKAAFPVSARETEQARLLTEQAAVYIDLSKHQEAVECAQRAEGLLVDSKSASEIGDVMQSLAITYRDAGQRDSFLELMNKARDMYRKVEDVWGEIRAVGNLAIDTLHWGDYQEAIRLFKQMLESLEESPNLAVIANIHLNLAIAYTDAAQLTQAFNCAEMSLGEYAKVGDRVGELMAHAAFAEVLKERAVEAAQSGDLKTAKDCVGKARQLVNEGLGLVSKEDLGVASSLYDLHRILAEAYLAVGEHEKSKEHLAKAETLAQQQEIEPQTYAQGRVVYAKLCGINGDYEQAHCYLEEARNTFIAQEYWRNVVPVDILRAEILTRAGKVKEARAVLEKARDLAEMRKRKQDKAKIASLLEQLPSA